MNFDELPQTGEQGRSRMTSPATMTLVELQKLVAESKGEWEHLEFKKTTGELHGGMETLCAFLNGVGGKVLFGVTTAGRIQGQDMADATYQEVANAIRKLEPPAWIEQIRVPVSGTKEVLILETTQRTDGPYTFDGRPYQRIGNTTSRMPQAEYQRRLLAVQRQAPMGEPGRRRIFAERSGHRGDQSGHPGRDSLRTARKPVVRPA